MNTVDKAAMVQSVLYRFCELCARGTLPPSELLFQRAMETLLEDLLMSADDDKLREIGRL